MKKPIHPLRRWLFENQETAVEFGLRALIKSSQLSEIMQDKKRPSLDTIDRITVATNGAITANDFQRIPQTQEIP